ncbi:hypothetical protein MRX96_041013 [Rhipicephalus microplus]
MSTSSHTPSLHLLIPFPSHPSRYTRTFLLSPSVPKSSLLLVSLLHNERKGDQGIGEEKSGRGSDSARSSLAGADFFPPQEFLTEIDLFLMTTARVYFNFLCATAGPAQPASFSGAPVHRPLLCNPHVPNLYFPSSSAVLQRHS